jgi:hypothetical protein
MHTLFLVDKDLNGLTTTPARCSRPPSPKSFTTFSVGTAEARVTSKRRTFKAWLGLLVFTMMGVVTLPNLNAEASAMGKPANEKESAPLWKRAIERYEATAGFLSGKILTVTSVSDGGGKRLGTVTQTDAIDLSKGTESPTWKLASKTVTGKPGLRFDADFGFQKDPRLIFKEYDRWSLVRSETEEGKLVEVWEGVAADEPENHITAHIDANSAWLLRAEFTFPFRFPLASMVVKARLVCAPNADGLWLPASMTIDQSGRAMFVTRKVVMEKTYLDWARPTLSTLPPEKVGSPKKQTTNKG